MAMPHQIVVMGVSGSGKSTIGIALAKSLDFAFVDGDDLHSAANVEKMAKRIPLNDEDRAPWLEAVGLELANPAHDAGVVLACSALRHAYRAAILRLAPATVFVYLEGSHELIAERMRHRHGHFMPLALLNDQFETLEPLNKTEPGRTFPIKDDVASITAEIVEYLGTLSGD